MRHLTLAAPPTTAPSLCVAACELVGGRRTLSLAAAAAVHLIAAAAHIHQNLPLTDRPNPNPRPNVNHIYGPNIELLTGDGIIPFGLELLAQSMDPAQTNQDKVLRAIIEISRAGGAHGIVEGHYRELDSEEWEENVCRKKEGVLHGCGAACGAILGGGNEEEIEGLRRFGIYAGTIRGLRASSKNGPGIEEKIRGLRDLAIKELEIFRGKELVEVVAGLC
ncbi:geranyl-diphosphate synthase [Striga asiatica]|uniref:Geranyl-diphosphate synthase n=1 Tax=Striga asiatica TaxID=4170 RepID=A0A5A7QIL8_STRAF|nr:geranyl-diphosphate synthase [Striga asiatica]